MDFHYLYLGQRFVWDSEKAANNEKKHGIRFETACEAFFDRFLRLVDASVPEESRDAAIGMTEDWTLLLVVHLYREDETIRIISARRATAQERKLYENPE